MAEEKKDDGLDALREKAAPGVTYTRPTSQLDLERRLEEDFLPESARVDNEKDDVRNPEKVNAPYKLEDNDTSAYRGVSSEYMTYANETEKPLTATEGPEAESLKLANLGTPGVRRSESKKAEPATEVGTVGTETLNTAVSGEDYSSKLVDAKPDYNGGPPVLGLPVEQAQAADAESKPTQATAPAPVASTTKSTAAKRTSSN